MKFLSRPKKIEQQLINFDAVLLLTISEPGRSGQRFDMDGLVHIDQLNSMAFRDNFRICVDGGVNDKIAPQLQVEELVSVGELDPNHIHVPGIFVQRIFRGQQYEKRIEQKTVRQRS